MTRALTTEPADLAGLSALDMSELREEWQRLVGQPAPPLRAPELLRRELAARLDARVHGDIDARLRQRLDRLAKQKIRRSGVSSNRTAPSVGSTLLREWDGVTYSVVVLKDGYLFEGETYGSLTKIAARITGGHWSGPRFFGLTNKMKP